MARGDEERARELGRLGIANVSGLAPVSDYVCVAVDDHGSEHSVVVHGHDRAAGFWPLLAPAVNFDGAEALVDERRQLASAIAAHIGMKP